MTKEELEMLKSQGVHYINLKQKTMTRNDLKKELRSAGIYYPSNLLKAELQAIYDANTDPQSGLLIRQRPDQPKQPLIQPPVEPIEGDEPLEEVDPSAPEITPEAEPPKERDSFQDLFSKIETAQAPTSTKSNDKDLFEATKTKKKKGASSPESFRVEGYILMLVIDTVFPFGLSTINNMLDKRMKVQAHQLSLSEQDFKKLEPLADQAADYLAVNLNPVAGFFLIATFMYGSNLLNVRMQLDVK